MLKCCNQKKTELEPTDYLCTLDFQLCALQLVPLFYRCHLEKNRLKVNCMMYQFQRLPIESFCQLKIIWWLTSNWLCIWICVVCVMEYFKIHPARSLVHRERTSVSIVISWAVRAGQREHHRCADWDKWGSTVGEMVCWCSFRSWCEVPSQWNAEKYMIVDILVEVVPRRDRVNPRPCACPVNVSTVGDVVLSVQPQCFH